jgi:hypothetical protein
MLGGWKLSIWEPALSPREQASADKVIDLGRMADPELRGKLDEYARHARGPAPYELPGRLAVFLGLVLFVSAGVRMYHTPPAGEADNDLQKAEASNTRPS